MSLTFNLEGQGHICFPIVAIMWGTYQKQLKTNNSLQDVMI